MDDRGLAVNFLLSIMARGKSRAIFVQQIDWTDWSETDPAGDWNNSRTAKWGLETVFALLPASCALQSPQNARFRFRQALAP